VRALLQAARVRPGGVVASSIGFGLGPRLNAAGRLGDALLSYNLLTTGDRREAERLAGRLNDRNRLRQELTAQAYDLAEEMALAEDAETPLLFAAHKGFMAGIVGLVAGRLTEAYYRPSVVVEKGAETSKGSCRSIPEFHITHALDECRDLLVRHGGHEAAAGFTVRTENLDELAVRLTRLAWQKLDGQELVPRLDIDAEVSLSELDWAVAEWLNQIEPCGQENPAPVFLSRDASVRDAQVVGNEGRHLKLQLEADGRVLDAIAFRQGERLDALGARVDVVYCLEVNEWNGERRLQLNVQDIRPAEV
jgi:single-stranded-DNA-specific exonuclease